MSAMSANEVGEDGDQHHPGLHMGGSAAVLRATRLLFPVAAGTAVMTRAGDLPRASGLKLT